MDKDLALTNGSPASLMMQAIQSKGDVDLDKMKQLLEIQKDWESNEAKKAFVVAMTAFKQDPPSIYKDKENKQYNSKYTSIDALVNPTIPHLSKNGLSHNWEYGQDGENIVVTCVLTHELGHSLSVTMESPPDKSGAKNTIQQIRSTHTYLKIATFEAVTGLVSREGNVDDDGNSAGEPVEYITEKQLSSIIDYMDNTETDEGKFLEWLKSQGINATELSEIPVNKFDFIIKTFQDKEKAQNK